MAYTNSGLVAYTKLSPNHSGQRTHSIDRISPHCVVGQCTAEGLGDWFAESTTRASSNYGIDKDGRVGMYVEEKNRSWCTSSNANDQRAITIECASDKTEPYWMNDKVYATLIKLCTDICKRNGKKKLLWFADKAKTLNYDPKADEMVITVHRWFANKSCPGDWLYARLGDVAARVTAALGGDTSPAVDGLTKGDTGDAVKTMQTMLISCGYSCGSAGADGDFGSNTLAGLTAFQTAAGLTADGIYGAKTKAALEKAYANLSVNQNTTTDEEKLIWDRLYASIGNVYGVAGVMGNFKAESNCRSNNLQNSYEKSLGMTDEQYTAAVDNGTYTNFINDKAGYGLYQATFWSIKESLLNFAKNRGASIGDRDMQVDHFLGMMKEEYTAIWKILTTAKTVREASDAVLLKFERPADQSASVQEKRAAFGEEFLNKYAPTVQSPVSQPAITINATYEKYINSTSTHYISNSGSDENGNYSGGKAGDQTGKEWQMRSWYSRPWLCVLRYPDQKVAMKLATLAIDAALNDKIGYDQGQNRTYLAQLKAVGWEPSKITVACEADCSAGICANVTAAGYLLGIPALQNHTGTYTGNMRSALTKAGFKLLTDSKYLTSTDYLLPGDLLLNDNHHTATNITIGAKVKGDWKPTASTTQYYRVRKSWSDKSSQIGAFTVLQNAILCVDANPGYAAFDETGKQIYPEQGSFTKYLLTDSQVKQIARLCQQEQGTVAGAKAEASLMANQLETSKSRQNKYGVGADGLYNWVRNGGWFSRAAHWMDNGSVNDAVLAGVRDVLINGNRTLPLYVDEHDCFSDIKSISTGEVKDRNSYIQGKTVVKNTYGSTWTFWCFPDSTSDPFGYTDAAYKAVNGPSAPAKTDFPYHVRISISDLNYRRRPGVNYDSWGYIEPGVYTIVDEQDGWGLLKAYADKRNGWVKLSYTERI